MTSRLALLVIGLFAAACATTRPTPEGSVAAAWVALGPGGAAQVRAITDGTACPSLTVDGTTHAMQIRAGADGGSFPVTACEALLPGGARAATVGGQALALPTPSPRRILVIGDTGCRMKAPDQFQACNDPAAWPFARVAARAAAWRPELVIHVGDYHYREAACPSGNAGCAGSPEPYTWASWRADFFAPAAPLLRAAPWVVIRGNHEQCSRAGEGWFRFLDPRPRPATCTDDTGPYVVPIGGPVIAVVDSSPASDDSAPPADVARYAAQLDQLAAMTPAYTWLATHRPVWGVDSWEGKLSFGNQTLQAAMRGRLPASVALLLAGHVHLFEGLAFEPRRPPMLLVGNGGTALDAPITQSLVGMTLDGATLTTAKTLSTFGYVTMEPVGSNWRAIVHDVEGRVLTECAIRPGTLVCAP
jgi:calcineurin-like phosphoesterase family protein